MNESLWNLYLSFQNEYAYGPQGGGEESPVAPEWASNGVVLPSERQVYTAQEWLRRIQQFLPLPNALVIGPGGPREVRALRGVLTGKLTALTAYDAEVAAIDEAQIPDVRAYFGDIHDMPFSHGIFNFIYASNVLEHCFAPYIALLECRRVLANQGLAYFVVPSFEGVEGGRGLFHLHCLTQDVWGELLRKTGYSITDVWRIVGEEDPTGHYLHFVCAAKTPPHPHDRFLQEVTSHKVIKKSIKVTA